MVSRDYDVRTGSSRFFETHAIWITSTEVNVIRIAYQLGRQGLAGER